MSLVMAVFVIHAAEAEGISRLAAPMLFTTDFEGFLSV
jgi:hypothetical protein